MHSITCHFADKHQIEVISKFLASRLEKAKTFKRTRKNHQFVPNGNNILMYSNSEVDFAVTNLTEHSPATLYKYQKGNAQKFYACYYVKD